MQQEYMTGMYIQIQYFYKLHTRTSYSNVHSTITRMKVNEARRPHTCSRPRAFEEKKIGEKKNAKKSAPPKTHHQIHSNPATATTSRRRAMTHVPRVRPHSPASIDPGFVEIGLVQLSQSVKTTNVTHTYTHRQTK